jgi:hypothetical protein
MVVAATKHKEEFLTRGEWRAGGGDASAFGRWRAGGGGEGGGERRAAAAADKERAHVRERSTFDSTLFSSSSARGSLPPISLLQVRTKRELVLPRARASIDQRGRGRARARRSSLFVFALQRCRDLAVLTLVARLAC